MGFMCEIFSLGFLRLVVCSIEKLIYYYLHIDVCRYVNVTQ